jgi:hypothetical protein
MPSSMEFWNPGGVAEPESRPSVELDFIPPLRERPFAMGRRVRLRKLRVRRCDAMIGVRPRQVS